MVDIVVYVITTISLGYALWSLWFTVRDKIPREAHVIGAGIVELLLVLQTAIAIVIWIADAGPEGGAATFVGYLLFVLILLPVALFVALAEKSRWGTAILTVAALLIPVLLVRLQQVWDGI